MSHLEKYPSMQFLSAQDMEELRAYVFDVVGCAIAVHQELGCGLSEYIYQDALAIALRQKGVVFEREHHFKVEFRGEVLKHNYYMDFLIKEDICFECKAVEKLADVHRQQLWNYMRLAKTPIGILYNFAPPHDQVEKYYLHIESGKISAF